MFVGTLNDLCIKNWLFAQKYMGQNEHLEVSYSAQWSLVNCPSSCYKTMSYFVSFPSAQHSVSIKRYSVTDSQIEMNCWECNPWVITWIGKFQKKGREEDISWVGFSDKLMLIHICEHGRSCQHWKSNWWTGVIFWGRKNTHAPCLLWTCPFPHTTHFALVPSRNTQCQKT